MHYLYIIYYTSYIIYYILYTIYYILCINYIFIIYYIVVIYLLYILVHSCISSYITNSSQNFLIILFTILISKIYQGICRSKHCFKCLRYLLEDVFEKIAELFIQETNHRINLFRFDNSRSKRKDKLVNYL